MDNLAADLIIALYTVGMTLFLCGTLRYFLLGYGVTAFKYGFCKSLTYYGIILVIDGFVVTLSNDTDLALAILGLGFAMAAYGVTEISNIGQSRKIEEIWKKVTNNPDSLPYKDALTVEAKLFLAIIMALCGLIIAIIGAHGSLTMVESLGVLILIIGGISAIFFFITRPTKIDETLCQTVIEQLHQNFHK